MKTLESLGMYAHSGRFDNPDDQIGFVEANLETIFAEAQKGYAIHGRGIVLLEPHGTGPFITARYVGIQPGDLDHLGGTAADDLNGYEPTSQMLVGVMDRRGNLGFWRMEIG